MTQTHTDTPGPGWIRRLLAECRRYPRLVAITLSVTALAVLIDLSVPLLTKAAIDEATGVATHGYTIGAIALVMVVLAFLRYGCQYGRRLTAGKLSLNVQNSLRLSVLDTVLRTDGAAQDQIRTGQVVSRSITDLQLVQGLLAMVPLSLGAALQVVLAIGVMFYLSPVLTLVALLVIPGVAAIAFNSRKRMFAATWSAQQSAADLAQHVEETVTGVRVVKGFGQEDRAVDELVGYGRRLYSLRLRAAKTNARFAPSLAAVPQLGMVAIIALGGYLTMTGSITVGTFLAFATYVTTMTGLARILTSLIVSAQLARAAVERVYGVIDEPTDPGLSATGRLPDGALGLELRDVTFTYPGAAEPVLRDLDLSIAPGEVVAVVGAPGSGKSTLAMLADRFYRPDSGSVELTTHTGSVRRQFTAAFDIETIATEDLRGAVGVVFDDPFLYSDTIAANIAPNAHVGKFDEEGAIPPGIVDAASQAQASGFVDALDNGFRSIVGERGLTLSGGQRQRIALARALYADPRVLILDDATSAVDAQTEARIFAHLRTSTRTMLLLAHRRSTLSLADRVAVLDGGRIIDIGTDAELTARCPEFRALMTTELDDLPDLAEDLIAADIAVDTTALWPADAPDALEPTRAVTNAIGGRGRGGGGGMAGALGAMPATPQLLEAVAALPPANEAPTDDDADIRKDRPDFSLRQLLRPVRWLLAVVVVCISIDTLVGLAFPTIARFGIDGATDEQSGHLWTATGLGLILVAIGFVSAAVMTVITARSGERVLYALRVRSYAHLQRLGLDYYERELSGRIMTRMTTDVDALSTFLQTGLSSAIVSSLTIVGVGVAVVLTDLSLGLLMLVVFPPIIIATIIFRRISSRAYTRSRELISEVNADFQENVGGVRTTQAYRHDGFAMARFTTRAAAYVRARMVSQQAISIYFPFITLMADLATAGIIAFGAHQVAEGQTSAGTLVAFVLYLGMLFGPVQQLSQVFDGYQQALVGLRRISDLLGTRSSVQCPDSINTPDDLSPTTTPPPINDFDGHAQLVDVTFRYSGATRDALSGVDLDLPAGTSLALVGETGAGKSTIVKLLARFYDPTTGSVRMDGTDIRGFRLGYYRSRLGVVPQEPHLFTGTVADNIAYGRPDATHEQIAAAAAAVGALPMIMGLDGAMNHPIGERGKGLSSGQRQLIALARAELVDPDLLLLDEATATLDQSTERRVLAAGRHLTGSRTSVIVAHRLATAARADRIAVVADGRIVELGTHRDLLALNGRYQALWTAGITPDEFGQSDPRHEGSQPA
ncbi:ABC transporter ATP-binding protein [Nocardia sp. 348MFTsu5.1]|uniref:ABC transporter ATP-binding protein n=1 Tax=Nocardia sp. 348MFTsu5.1 TaxID=1172185 RepID=UPI00036C4A68|nr:ABC transporter ATP-binding protein [Nocardia sp. 348MFTsu5.1]